MDIRQLNYFIVLSESNTISEAAKKLEMAQPPLSQMLKNLELELGTKLIKRSKKKHQLTKSGEILYQEALNIVKQLGDMQGKIQQNSLGLTGQLKIGSTDIALNQLKPALVHFFKNFPNVSLIIEQSEAKLLKNKLKSGALDLAFIQGSFDKDLFISHFSFSEKLFFVTSEPLESKKMSFSDFYQKPLLLPNFQVFSKNNTFFKKIVTKQPNDFIISYCSNYLLIQELVATQLVNSILPESMLETSLKINNHYYPITPSTPVTHYHLISLKERYLDQITLNFIEQLKN